MVHQEQPVRRWSITAAGDVTATVVGVGVIAYGPDGLTQPLVDRLSP
jgi:hypothetical protein